jgi:Asp-tRNA(Asn)/Glu-tRNA(Gln) amidotransferase A subunit family amidase
VVLGGHDAAHPYPRAPARPPLAAVAASAPPLPPRFAFVRSPAWPHAEAVTGSAFAEVVETLGEAASEVTPGAGFERAIDMHRIVMEVETAHNLHRDYEKGAARMSQALRELIGRGRAHPAIDYVRAVAAIEPLNAALDPVFDEYDAILTPAAPGEAPRGLAGTGSPVFCSIWTYLGTPAVTLPLMQGPSGMPLGVQLVARRGNDARLLRTANWLVETLARGGRRRSAARAHARGPRKRTPAP